MEKPKAARKPVKAPGQVLTVVLQSVADLIPYARNARTHTDDQVAQIAASIREFGWTVPVLIDGKGAILAGHGRVLAARKLGMTDVPCIALTHLTDAQRRAYVLADNKLALNAQWDPALLNLELGDLRGEDIDLGLIGFSNDELRDIVFPVGPKAKSGARALSDGLSYQVIVECEGEGQQTEVLEDLRGRGIKCKPLIL